MPLNSIPPNPLKNPLSPEEMRLKHEEIARRGLAGFPVPSPHDLECIERLAVARQALKSDVKLTLPETGLKLMTRSIISDELLYYLMIGDYEKSDLNLLEAAVRPGDRIVDAGGGVGVCAAWMGLLAKQPVTVIEAREDLAPYILETLAINGVEGSIVHGALCDTGMDMVEFGIGDNLWFSSMNLTGQPNTRTIRCPRISLQEACSRFTPDVFLMDIEGAEATLDFQNLTHKPRDFIVEIHTPSLGSRETCRIINHIIQAGYMARDVVSQTWWFTKS